MDSHIDGSGANLLIINIGWFPLKIVLMLLQAVRSHLELQAASLLEANKELISVYSARVVYVLPSK